MFCSLLIVASTLSLHVVHPSLNCCLKKRIVLNYHQLQELVYVSSVVIPASTVWLNPKSDVAKIVEGTAASIKHEQHSFQRLQPSIIKSSCHLAVLSCRCCFQVVQSKQSVDESIQYEAARSGWILLIPVILTKKSERRTREDISTRTYSNIRTFFQIKLKLFSNKCTYKIQEHFTTYEFRLINKATVFYF